MARRSTSAHRWFIKAAWAMLLLLSLDDFLCLHPDLPGGITHDYGQSRDYDIELGEGRDNSVLGRGDNSSTVGSLSLRTAARPGTAVIFVVARRPQMSPRAKESSIQAALTSLSDSEMVGFESVKNGGIDQEQFKQHVLSSDRDEAEIKSLMKALFPRGSEPENKAQAARKDEDRPKADTNKKTGAKARVKKAKSQKKSPKERISEASRDSAATRSSGAAAARSRMQNNGGGQTKASKDAKKTAAKKGNKGSSSSSASSSSTGLSAGPGSGHKRQSRTAEEQEILKRDRKAAEERKKTSLVLASESKARETAAAKKQMRKQAKEAAKLAEAKMKQIGATPGAGNGGGPSRHNVAPSKGTKRAQAKRDKINADGEVVEAAPRAGGVAGSGAKVKAPKKNSKQAKKDKRKDRKKANDVDAGDGGWPELTQEQIDMEAAAQAASEAASSKDAGSGSKQSLAEKTQSAAEKKRLNKARRQQVASAGGGDAHTIASDDDGWPSGSAAEQTRGATTGASDSTVSAGPKAAPKAKSKTAKSPNAAPDVPAAAGMAAEPKTSVASSGEDSLGVPAAPRPLRASAKSAAASEESPLPSLEGSMGDPPEDAPRLVVPRDQQRERSKGRDDQGNELGEVQVMEVAADGGGLEGSAGERAGADAGAGAGTSEDADAQGQEEMRVEVDAEGEIRGEDQTGTGGGEQPVRETEDIVVEVVEELPLEDEASRAAAEAAEEWWTQRLLEEEGDGGGAHANVESHDGPEIYVTTSLYEGLSGVA